MVVSCIVGAVKQLMIRESRRDCLAVTYRDFLQADDLWKISFRKLVSEFDRVAASVGGY